MKAETKTKVQHLKSLGESVVRIQTNNGIISQKQRDNKKLFNTIKEEFYSYYSLIKKNDKEASKAEIIGKCKTHIQAKLSLYGLEENNTKVWNLFEALGVYYIDNLSINLSQIDYADLIKLIKLYQDSKKEMLSSDLVIKFKNTSEKVLEKGALNPFNNTCTKSAIKKNSVDIKAYIKSVEVLRMDIEAKLYNIASKTVEKQGEEIEDKKVA